MALFQDRRQAGRTLGELVRAAVPHPATALVLGLPRGGVPVAFEVAHALRAELDVFLVRKIGMPGEEELALGAIASGGIRVLNEGLVRYLQVPAAVIEEIATREQAELERQERAFRGDRAPVAASGRPVVLVDDGLATGASMLAATRAIRPLGAKTIVVAVPVAARSTCDEFRSQVDQVICAATPEPFGSVGAWYEDFSQTTDEDVRRLLAEASAIASGPRTS
ncbi:MAG TPA: phosphoribosyltransferase [Bryobacteraceae bacterium]